MKWRIQYTKEGARASSITLFLEYLYIRPRFLITIFGSCLLNLSNLAGIMISAEITEKLKYLK